MERQVLTIRGERASDVPSAFQDISSTKREDYDGDGFVVLVFERYFYRVLSNLQSTVIVEKIDETTCEVTIVSGGGGYGLPTARDLGSEADAAKKLVRQIESFCEDADLSIEHPEGDDDV